MAKGNKNQRAARRQAARKQAARKQPPARDKAAGKQPPAKQAAGTPAPKPSARSVAPGEASAEAMSAARRVAWWALLAMVFLVPVAMSNLTFLGFRLPITYDEFDIVKVFFQRVLGLVALAAWAWDLLRRGGKVRRTPIDWLILAFIVWVALTTVTSIHWPIALFGKPRRYEGLLSFVNYAVIYFLVLQFAGGAARVRTLARALFFSSLIVAGYGLLQFIGWDPATWGTLPFEANRAFSTYGNPDLLGGFLMFSTPVALGLALAEPNLVWRLVYWAGFAVNGVTLIVAFTRGAWIGGALGLALVAVIAWRHRVRLRRVDWIPAAVSAALGGGIIWRSLSNPDEVMNFGKRLASIFQFGGGSGQTRNEIWQAAFAAVKERPILGWGADTFRLVFPKFKPVEYVRDAGGASVADNAHNYPLQLATGVGIPGMLMMYGIFVWAGVRSFGTVFGRTDDPTRIVLGAFWAAAAGYLVQLLFGVSVTGNTFLLWAALGVVHAPTARVVEVKAPKWGTAAAVVILALAALGIVYQVLPVSADAAYLTANAAPSAAARVEAARRAVKLNPLSGIYRSELGLAYAAEVRAYLNAGDQAQKAGEDTSSYAAGVKSSFAAAETAFKDAIAFQPDEYDNYVFLAGLYNLAGQVLDKSYYDKAIAVARRGLVAEPYGTAVRVELARALISTGKTAEGIKELEYSVKIDPAGGQAALLLAQVYEQDGRAAEALALLKSVDALAPGQAGVAEAIQRLEAGATPTP
ncbi:MAG: O-antigen ligase family protein [Actinobacteria bacterium]|nr:O-antigen ligase family protein [Actinomycetota bacterium]